MERTRKHKLRWNIIVSIAVIITILTFSPAIIPYHVHEPELLGFPYSFWTGILVSVLMVGLTIYGSTVCPGAKSREG